MPDGDAVLTIRPKASPPALTFSRQYLATWWLGAKVPFRWTLITASQSPSVIENIMRSRRIPALLMRMSQLPNVSMACWTISPAASKSATLAPFTTASPPMARISSTTDWAGVVSAPSPVASPPRSFTTTLAPFSASSRACSLPIPRPAPVTMATRPAQMLPI